MSVVYTQYKFLSCDGQWTDPRLEENQKLFYFSAEGNSYYTPQRGPKCMDATANWSPLWVIGDISTMSWANVAALACEAAKHPKWECYTGYLNKEKTLTFGGYSVTARIVGVGQDILQDGSRAGFTFNIYKGFGGKHNMYDSTSSPCSSYYNSPMRTWLESQSFSSDVSPYLENFRIGYRNGANLSASANYLYAKVGLMSFSNAVLASWFSSGASSVNYIFDDEGPHYSGCYSTARAGSYTDNTGTSVGAWFLTPRSTTYFCAINEYNTVGSNLGTQVLCPSIRFCIGSSR